MTDQPPPTPNAGPCVWDLVIEDMRSRDAVGRERYKVPLQPFNGRDQLADAYAEALDLSVYLRTAIYERDHPMTFVTTPESIANAARLKEAEGVPPTALPADVYLDKLERLLLENAKLKALLGESLGLCRNISGMIETGENWGGSAWFNEAVFPLKNQLKDALGIADHD